MILPPHSAILMLLKLIGLSSTAPLQVVIKKPVLFCILLLLALGFNKNGVRAYTSADWSGSIVTGKLSAAVGDEFLNWKVLCKSVTVIAVAPLFFIFIVASSLHARIPPFSLGVIQVTINSVDTSISQSGLSEGGLVPVGVFLIDGGGSHVVVVAVDVGDVGDAVGEEGSPESVGIDSDSCDTEGVSSLPSSSGSFSFGGHDVVGLDDVEGA